jgi:hypothetical protein
LDWIGLDWLVGWVGEIPLHLAAAPAATSLLFCVEFIIPLAMNTPIGYYVRKLKGRAMACAFSYLGLCC